MRTIGAGLVACLIGGGSHGAMAVEPPGAVDWSGFYIGGMAGTAISKAQMQSIVGVSKYLDAIDTRQIDRAGNNDMVQWRPAAGLVGGYGAQFGNVLVGLEASANSLFLNDEFQVIEPNQSNPGKLLTLKQSVTADWMATLRPRLGWAEDNWLGYLTGGIAITRLKLDGLYTDNAFSGYSHSSESRIVTGVSLGFGGEYDLGNNWSLRGEYLYTRFGQMEISGETTSTNNSGGTLDHKAMLESHAVMIGMSYRFKGL